MSSVLRVSGQRFAAREFAQRSSLPICAVHVRGDLRAGGKPGGKRSQNSGVAIVVSDSEFTDLKGQIRDAVKFLTKHQRAISRLTKLSGVESSTLDFGIASRSVAAQFDCFSPELLLLLGKLGIGLEISRYDAMGPG